MNEVTTNKACPECGGAAPSPNAFLKAVSVVEDTVISVILIGMILLVLTQILLRNFMATGVSGGFNSSPRVGTTPHSRSCRSTT